MRLEMPNPAKNNTSSCADDILLIYRLEEFSGQPLVTLPNAAMPR